MKKINKKGFTLIELLLVIAIIGILAAVLFVSLGSQRDRARETAFKESMRSIVPAATICRDRGQTVVSGTANSTDDVCGDSSAQYPGIPVCNGTTGSFVDITVADGTTDQWTAVATCTTSAGDDCDATCDSGGCSFVGAGCN
ncbi:MAG: type II secretion system protein [Patescibacteria group bacterium]|nr:type II secretion system protein [Patescibacteria group bacterium]